MSRFAVVGHVEWVDFVRVERVPEAGEIVTAEGDFAEPAGGGAVAAVTFARLAGACTFFTALGDDELGHRAVKRLTELGVRVEVAWRAQPQRRAWTFVDAAGERTITVIGEKLRPRAEDPLPWVELSLADGAFFVAGDGDALREARRAATLTATPRELDTLAAAGVALDTLVGSGRDPSERYEPGDIEPPPRLAVATQGERGGEYTTGERSGRYDAAAVPGPIADSYGCGDSFAAGLTFALARGEEVEAALEFAAHCGASCLTGSGPYGRQRGAQSP